MADLKISQLTGATTPLAGTEVLPIVQSSTTKKIATDDLTVKNIRSNATNGILQVAGPAAAATRTMTVPDANFTAARTDAAQSFTGDQTLSTGNLIIGTSGKGIDFSATPGTGTSELLADYEEGTFTPTVTCSVSGTITPALSADTLSYTKIGRVVSIYGNITISSVSLPDGIILLTLPFTVANLAEYQSQSGMPMSISGCVLASTNSFVAIFEKNSSTMKIFNGSANSLAATAANELQGSAELWFSVSYVAA
jgi:hypothetical protein